MPTSDCQSAGGPARAGQSYHCRCRLLVSRVLDLTAAVDYRHLPGQRDGVGVKCGDVVDGPFETAPAFLSGLNERTTARTVGDRAKVGLYQQRDRSFFSSGTSHCYLGETVIMTKAAVRFHLARLNLERTERATTWLPPRASLVGPRGLPRPPRRTALIPVARWTRSARAKLERTRHQASCPARGWSDPGSRGNATWPRHPHWWQADPRHNS